MRIGKILLVTACLFTSFTTNAASEKCRISGCSGEICEADNGEPTVGICIWSEQFACYKTATCEEQPNGKCGWTMTDNLKQCLAEKKNTGINPMPMPLETK